MSTMADRILQSLAAVDGERLRRAAVPGLAERVAALKSWQRERFARTHADLLVHPRHGRAARFFLDELYGPQDFTQRDGQFARIVPALVRLFPQDVVRTVEALAEVHALSERLDTRMAEALAAGELDRAGYVRAWQAVGEPASRARQVALVLQVGEALDRHTRSLVLRASLKARRAPAPAAGLSTLQAFLEAGFDAFGAMRGADEFLQAIAAREHVLAQRLVAPDAVAVVTAGAPVDDPLAGLP
jgi:hypothetical protein